MNLGWQRCNLAVQLPTVLKGDVSEEADFNIVIIPIDKANHWCIMVDFKVFTAVIHKRYGRCGIKFSRS